MIFHLLKMSCILYQMINITITILESTNRCLLFKTRCFGG
jgi:hypothetical protein